MQEALAVLIFVVVAVGAVAAIASLAAGRRAYEDIGRTGLAIEPPAPPGWADPGAEAEVRADVERRNARLLARGQPPLDVEAEVRRRLLEHEA